MAQPARDYVEKKARRIGRHLPSASKMVVDLASGNVRSQDYRIVAQLTLVVNGVILRSEERGQSVMAAIDAAADAIDRRIDRYKAKFYRVEKTRRVLRRGQSPPEQPQEVTAQGSSGQSERAASPTVVRNKSFPAKPMAVDEAVFQLEMLGHDFFLFLNSEVGAYNVIYRRRDGTYGLIQPEPL